MAKTKEQVIKASKDRRKRLLDSNLKLKTRKNWYTVSTAKRHFTRKAKLPNPSSIKRALHPGQIVILLSGRFRGRRVVLLKKLDSGLLLVTGPYKYNGVPLKRVNQAYVIGTKTKVDIKGIAVDSIKDDFFKRDNEIKRENEKDFFEEPKTKKERITNQRKTAQATIDTAVKKVVDQVPLLKDYLKNKFALKHGDKPHLMQF